MKLDRLLLVDYVSSPCQVGYPQSLRTSLVKNRLSRALRRGQPPTITNPKLQPRNQEVCFETFAVLHSGISRTPPYSAEHLTRQNLEEAKTLSRRDSFHAERALPVSQRSELSDYARSGYSKDLKFATEPSMYGDLTLNTFRRFSQR